MGRIFRKTLTALLIVTGLLTAAIVGAAVKLYTATGEDYASEIESQDIAKLRARDKAIKKATKEAGVYLKTYSRSVNNELTDDEVTAITSNAWQLVGEPKYSSEIKKLSDETSIIIWRATVEVNVDDSEIQSWIKRDDKDKSTIITQTREAQKTSEENERKIEDLREQYKRATSQAERDRIIKQMNDADRDFLANQKLEKGLKLHYGWNDKGAIELYNEALEINPNFSDAYKARADIYMYSAFVSHNYEKAVADYTKAIELKPNFYEAYKGRARCYHLYLKVRDEKKAVADYTKAIEFNPIDSSAYKSRASCYYSLHDYEKAIADYTKVIEFNPTDSSAYRDRAKCYFWLKDYKKAVADYTKAIKLRPKDKKALSQIGFYYSDRAEAYEKLKDWKKALADYDKYVQYYPESSVAYSYRAHVYYELKNYNAALQDYTKAIKFDIKSDSEGIHRFARAKVYIKLGNYNKAIEDLERVIQLYPIHYVNNKDFYQLRGLCYQQLGDEAKAQVDFAKAKELGWKG